MRIKSKVYSLLFLSVYIINILLPCSSYGGIYLVPPSTRDVERQIALELERASGDSNRVETPKQSTLILDANVVMPSKDIQPMRVIEQYKQTGKYAIIGGHIVSLFVFTLHRYLVALPKLILFRTVVYLVEKIGFERMSYFLYTMLWKNMGRWDSGKATDEIALRKDLIGAYNKHTISKAYYAGIGLDIYNTLKAVEADTIVGVDPIDDLYNWEIEHYYWAGIIAAGAQNVTIEKIGTLGNGGKLVFRFSLNEKEMKYVFYREDVIAFNPNSVLETQFGYDLFLAIGFPGEFNADNMKNVLRPLSDDSILVVFQINDDCSLTLPVAKIQSVDKPGLGIQEVWRKLPSSTRQPERIMPQADRITPPNAELEHAL